MKYVVVGGAGFIGSHIVDKLVEQNHEVVIIDNLSTGKMENVNPKASVEYIDISNVNECPNMVEIMSGADALFLLAAKARVQPSIENPVEYETNNTIGTLNVLKCASDAGVRRVVYSASSSAYGNTEKLPSVESDPINPMSPYGAQKYYGEVMCKMFSEVYGLETVSLRYFNIYGERQNVGGAYAMVIGIFADQKLRGEVMTINGDGEQRRDFTYVGDVVNANILASQSENVGNGEVINIGNGDNRSINDIADMIGGERIHREPVIEPKETLADNSLAEKLLGWKPTQNIEDWVPGYKKELGLDV
jgi:UDP-glucose 4-epimerase|tara:strand:+ start:1034 stop:1948 length:915 start_codon:yes stop_codon:yes gene_type:complete